MQVVDAKFPLVSHVTPGTLWGPSTTIGDMRIRSITARLAAVVALSALGIGGLAVAASAHGGDITIDASGSVSGSTVTYSVHLIWEDGHDVIGQGVVVDASGPGGSRSATLPATNSSGRTSGSITLGDGTWSVTFSTDGGSRTISQKVGADPVTAPPPAPAPTAAPAPAPTAAPAPAAPPTTRRAGGAATTTTRPGATSTTTVATADTTPTTAAVAAETTVVPDTSTTSSTSTTSTSTTTSIAVTEIATSTKDDGGGSAGVIAAVVVALVAAAGGAVFWRRRVSAAAGTSLPSAGVSGE